MLNQFPLTGLTALIGIVVMVASWVMIRKRMDSATGPTQRPVRLLHNFFLLFAIFYAFMLAPYYFLVTSPSDFPLAMSWGYVVGHIFLYLALMYVARMVCSLVPRLNKVEPFLVGAWLVMIAVITVINAKTMIFGLQPLFDYENNITQFRAATVVGAAIGLSGMISSLPAVVLFFTNAIKGTGPARMRSLMLAIGFLIFVFAGPLHDLAKTGTVYALADVFSIMALVIIGVGVLYRFEQNLAPARPLRPAMAAPSNTV